MSKIKIPEKLPYDISSASSVFEYSKGLLGKTLRDFVWEDYQPKKGKGGRDLYLIKIVRIGSKTEIHPDLEDAKAPRLVFELEYLESFPKYKMIHLNFQHTFADTFLGRVLEDRL